MGILEVVGIDEYGNAARRSRKIKVLTYIAIADDPKSSLWSDESRNSAGMGSGKNVKRWREVTT